MSFNSLGLSNALLKAVSKQGYTTPSPIQQKAIPLILEGKDILASAQTGTGKTTFLNNFLHHFVKLYPNRLHFSLRHITHYRHITILL